jgi:mRNA-degrading endonuclease YafQ of YafQ-DinJ toxin-antitoxin module
MRVRKTVKFLRALKKYSRKLTYSQGKEVIRRLTLFEHDWQAPELKTHKLRHAEETWSFTVLDDVNRSDRALFVFQKREQEKDIVLLNIGPHDLVYREF